jgi:hypothetical protein
MCVLEGLGDFGHFLPYVFDGVPHQHAFAKDVKLDQRHVRLDLQAVLLLNGN